MARCFCFNNRLQNHLLFGVVYRFTCSTYAVYILENHYVIQRYTNRISIRYLNIRSSEHLAESNVERQH